MPTAPVAAADFVALVQKSGLLSAAQLDDFLKRNAPLPESPKQVAQLFLKDGLLTRFHAAHLLSGKHRGFILGQYKILQQIGAGGMGVIFLGEHVGMGRKVAIKVLPASRAADRESLERFYREARVVAALDHPNIVRAYDANKSGSDVHFLVMEYIEGESLEERVRRKGPLPPQEAASFISQAAAGLQHAHEKGLVHRDIKPHNLLLDKNGIIKVLDMGLARFFDDPNDALTRELADGAVIGTADYISPEQAVDSHDVDIRADIYSLGCTFYFFLVGSPPFGDSSVTQKLLAHHMKDPTAIHLLRPEVPEEMSAVIARMMAKHPDDRYQSPADVIAAVAPWTNPRYVPAPSTTHIRSSATPTPVSRSNLAVPLSKTMRLPPATPKSGSSSGVKSAVKSGVRSGAKSAVRPVDTGRRPVWLPWAGLGLIVMAGVGIWLATRGSHSSSTQPKFNIPVVRKAEPPKQTAPEAIRTFTGHTDGVENVAFLPGGKRLVSLGHDGLRIWEFDTGQEVPGDEMKDNARSLSVSADGKRAATAGNDRTARVWDLEKRQQLGSRSLGKQQVGAVAILPDGKRFAVGCEDGAILLCDSADGQILSRLTGHEGLVYALAAAPDGRHLLSGSLDTTVRLWDIDTGTQLQNLIGHEKKPHALALHWEKRLAVSGAADNTARIWDLETGKELRVLRGHTDIVTGVAISPDARRVLTTSGDRLAILWDVDSGAELGRCAGHTDRAWSAAFAPDGRQAVTSSKDHTIIVWKLPELPEPAEPASGELLRIACDPQPERIALSPTGRNLLIGTREDLARIVNTLTGTEVTKLPGHRGTIWCVGYSPTGARAVTAGKDGTVRVWDIASSGEVNKTSVTKGDAWTAQFAPDGRSVFFAGTDGIGRLWDPATGEVRRTFTGHQDAINWAAFSPDGSRIYTASWDGSVRGWNTQTGIELFAHKVNKQKFRALSVAPGGKSVLVGGDNGYVALLDAEDGSVRRKFEGFSGHVWTTSFSPDGRLALAGGDRKEVVVWNVIDGSVSTVIQAPGQVSSAVFGPDGRRVYLACRDKSVRVWVLPTTEGSPQ
jgi:eukaryotic-like serine/threonine-protein kinase